MNGYVRKTDRQGYGQKRAAILAAGQGGRVFTLNDVAGEYRRTILIATATQMVRKGLLLVVKRGTPGCKGLPAQYKVP